MDCRPAPSALNALEDELITVSHELRAPLTVVYGVLQTLQRPATDLESGLRDELVAVAVQEVQRMIAVVDGISSRREEVAHASHVDHMKPAV